MKQYRCVFSFSNGRTTIDVDADNAQRALDSAAETVRGDAVAVQIWDETGLVLQRRDWSPSRLKAG